MAALALVAPDIFKQVLECLGWRVAEEGKLNWTLVKNGIPVTIPRRGKLVSRIIFESLIEEGIITPGSYLKALKKIGYSFSSGAEAP
jgi:hypothetical protein